MKPPRKVACQFCCQFSESFMLSKVSGRNLSHAGQSCKHLWYGYDEYGVSTLSLLWENLIETVCTVLADLLSLASLRTDTYWSSSDMLQLGFHLRYMKQSEGWAATILGVTDQRDSQRGDCLCGCIWVEAIFSLISCQQSNSGWTTLTQRESSQLLWESSGRIDCLLLLY